MRCRLAPVSGGGFGPRLQETPGAFPGVIAGAYCRGVRGASGLNTARPPEPSNTTRVSSPGLTSVAAFPPIVTGTVPPERAVRSSIVCVPAGSVTMVLMATALNALVLDALATVKRFQPPFGRKLPLTWITASTIAQAPSVDTVVSAPTVATICTVAVLSKVKVLETPGCWVRAVDVTETRLEVPYA